MTEVKFPKPPKTDYRSIEDNYREAMTYLVRTEEAKEAVRERLLEERDGWLYRSRRKPTPIVPFLTELLEVVGQQD